jgi:hypothetical protein
MKLRKMSGAIMTKLETLIKIAGNRSKLARIIGVHKTTIDWWARTYSPKHREDMPIKYNQAMMDWARDNLDDETCAQVNAALVKGCPTCGRPW